jgi:hypothetical protein
MKGNLGILKTVYIFQSVLFHYKGVWWSNHNFVNLTYFYRKLFKHFKKEYKEVKFKKALNMKST